MHVGSSLFTFLDFKYLAWLFAMKEWVVRLLTLYKSSSVNSSKVETFVLSDVLSVLFHWVLDTSSSMSISVNLFLRKVCRAWKPGQFSQRYTIHSNCSVLHAIIFIKSLYVKLNFSVYVTVSVALWTSSSFFFSLPFKYLLMILLRASTNSFVFWCMMHTQNMSLMTKLSHATSVLVHKIWTTQSCDVEISVCIPHVVSSDYTNVSVCVF